MAEAVALIHASYVMFAASCVAVLEDLSGRD